MLNFFYKTKGVISIFLIMILLPTFATAAILVDGSRYQSAKTMVQEAGDLAAYSVIANYNIDLKDEFGLFGIADKNVQSAFTQYFEETLGYNGNGEETYSDKVQNFISSTIFNGGNYANRKFSNLYNFDATATVTPLYPLSEPAVLQNQIVEYTKYRGIETLLERFEIISGFQGVSDAINNNNETAAAIEDVAVTSSKSQEISTQLNYLLEDIKVYNQATTDSVTAAANYEMAYAEEMCELATKGLFINSAKNKRRQEYQNLINCKNTIVEKRNKIIERCGHIEGLVSMAKTDYEGLKSRYSNQTDIVKDIDKEIANLNKIVSTNSADANYSVKQLKSMMSNSDVATFMDNTVIPKVESANKKIEAAYTDYQEEYNELRKELDADETLFEIEKQLKLAEVRYHIDTQHGSEWYYTVEDYTTGNTDGMDNSAVTTISSYDIKGSLSRKINTYKCGNFQNYYYVAAVNTDQSVLEGNIKEEEKEDYAKNTAESTNKAKNDNLKGKSAKTARQTISSSKLSQLPSKNRNTTQIDEVSIPDVNSDNASNAISSANSNASKMSSFLESGRNDVLTFAYMLDMFKTRVTENKINSKDKPTGISDRNLVDWRYSNDVGELDMRYREKAALVTAFATSEVEYIFGGRASEKANEAIVYSWIYGTRFANNIIAVYTNSTAKAECDALAAMSSAATWGTVPAIVFFWIYVTAWAAAETALELSYLIDDGYKVPLVKANNLFIQHFWDIATAIANSDSLMRRKATASGWADKLNVAYEDYLIILLCFVGRETRLLRIADLVQLNMQERIDSNFKMTESYTYVKADTSVNMRHLFQPVRQFTNIYKSPGLTLKNTIFQGY